MDAVLIRKPVSGSFSTHAVTLILCLYVPPTDIEADWVKHRKYVGIKAFRGCANDFEDYFSAESVTARLISHRLVDLDELNACITPKAKAWYVWRQAGKGGKHGWHVLYMCIRDSASSHLGHKDLATELEKKGE